MASVVPWPFLCSSSPTPAGSNNRSFAQAVTNSCKVQQNQLPKPAIKGDSLCIKISQGEYEKGFEDCQHNLRGRLFLSKGDKPISASNLHEKLLALWKPTGNWKIIPLGKGFFDFEFSSMEDLKKIWAAGSWNLKPGILRLSKWSSDFSIRNHNQTHVQVWIRLIDLPQEYWRHTTLFEIANGIGTPITLDNATKNRTFGHFARILVDLDLSKRIFNEIMVEREGFSFYVEIQYERLPDYCNNCATIGHSIGQCKWLHNNYNASNEVVKKQKENAHKGEASDIVKHPIPQEAGKHEVGKTKSSGGSKIIIEEDPLIIDIIRSREMTTTIHVEDAIKFVEETSSISVETLPVHIVQVEDTLALTETRNGNQQSNSFADMRITGPWCDAVTDMDYGNDHNLDNFEQELGTNNSIVGTDLNLSNFSANVIHDMQVLGLVPTVAQQTMDFLSDSWTNMGQKEDQPFQLVVPRKKKSKKKQPEASKGFKNALVLLYLACASFAACFLEGYCWTRTGERQAARMRARYLKAVLRQEVAYFDLHVTSTSEVITSVSNDSLVIQDVLSEKVPNFLMNASMFIGSYIVAFALLWRLAIVGFPFVVLLVIPGFMYGRTLMGLARKMREEYNQAGTIAEQAISSIRTVYSFAGESKTITAFSDALEGSVKLGLKQGLAKGLAIGSNGVVFAIWSFMSFYGSRMVMYHGAKGGTVFAVGASLALGGLALGAGLSNVKYFSEASVAGERIMEMIKRVPKIDSENMEGEILEKVLGDVEFNHVEFVYPSRPENVILNDFCLKVPSGKTVALVGGSGSGKSTVVSLLQRFYDPIGGEILLDGVAIHKLQLKWLRSQMGLVSQEPALFATSIKENILFGREDATFEEIVDAAKASNAHNFISMLPQGYDTQVGERGVQMSGGQKQRIAIARAIIKMPKILLLDEATSALDSESERVVQEALDKAAVGRTTIIIAHRLSTIQNADIIAVVQNGKIMETGSHESLMQNENSLYTSLVRLQQTRNDQSDDTPSIMNRGHMQNTSSRRLVSRSSSSFNSMTHGGDDILNYNNVVEDIVNNVVVVDDRNNHDSKNNKKKEKVKVPSFRRLLAMNVPEWKQACLGCINAVLFGAIQPVYSFALGSVVSVYFLEDHDEIKKQIRIYIFCFLGLAVISMVVNVLQHYSFAYMGEYLTKRVRERMFSKILTFEVGWFDEDQNSTGSVCSRLAKDANVVRSLVGDRLALVVQTISAVVIAFTMGLIIAWRLAIVMIAVQPVIICCFYTRRVLLKNMSSKAIKAQDECSKIAAEAVSNLRTINAFSSQDRILKILEKAQQGPSHESIRQSWFAGIGLACSQSLNFCTWALDFWYGGKLVSQGYISAKALFETFMILVSTGRVIADAGSMTNDLAKGSDAVGSVFAILDRYTKIEPDDLEGYKAEKLIGKIELRDVYFAYPGRPNVMIFQGFSIKIDAGKSTALVGESGSGKSTIIGLIERFYDPLNGIVTIDGRDIKTYNLRSLRKHIALVSQEPTLFSGTIRENIAYGAYDDTVDESEIIEASKASNAHDFVSSLKDGYDTLCGDRGVQLSGGQKQRIAIARAILKNPEVLLLDEATSALDSQSEKLVQEALERVMVGRTSVVVAHRLSTIQNCDLIAVLDKGSVVEKGTHSSLLSKGSSGAYYSLVSLQRRPTNLIVDSSHEIN